MLNKSVRKFSNYFSKFAYNPLNYQMAENKMIKAVQVLRQAKQQETLGYVYLLSRLGYCNVKCGR